MNDTSSHGSESESYGYHLGDGMPPRNPERSTIARTKNGQRRVWLTTPGRPQMKPHEMEQTVFMRGGAGSDDDAAPAEERRLLSGRDRRMSTPFEFSPSTTVNGLESTQERLVRVYPRPSPIRPSRPANIGSRFTERMEFDGAQLYADSLRGPGRFGIRASLRRSSRRSGRNRAQSLPFATIVSPLNQHKDIHLQPVPSLPHDDTVTDPEGITPPRQTPSAQPPQPPQPEPEPVPPTQPESQSLLQLDSPPSSEGHLPTICTPPMSLPQLQTGRSGR
ncbi:hypothetical protein G6011_05465 [Alternaria panax]|uniref:Uncharacterized protein n=1 Tax=Alternaria panax TaxID=48097 RepID=A0AAD4FHC2_9PLEO|nr:hypothetical protein G6011_05465 [Alternaria panax]